jgi:DNA repair protein RadC
MSPNLPDTVSPPLGPSTPLGCAPRAPFALAQVFSIDAGAKYRDIVDPIMQRANLDMKGFHQEVVRVVLLDTQHRCSTKLDIAKGTVNESLAHPREVLRPAIIHSAYAFVLVHNHPSGTAKPSEADLQITKCIASAARILQIHFLDHVIVGEGFFSFQEAGLLCVPWLQESLLFYRQNRVLHGFGDSTS